MTEIDHNKIITKTATAFFKKYGVTRKGKSRTFYDDNCWFTTIIEFQPHPWQKGTFLNVGVNSHWYEKDYFSFDIGHREIEFTEFTNSEQFQSKIEDICETAIKKVFEYRDDFKTLKDSREKIINWEFTSDNLWGNYNKGTVLGLLGEFSLMKSHFEKLGTEDFFGLCKRSL